MDLVSPASTVSLKIRRKDLCGRRGLGHHFRCQEPLARLPVTESFQRCESPDAQRTLWEEPKILMMQGTPTCLLLDVFICTRTIKHTSKVRLFLHQPTALERPPTKKALVYDVEGIRSKKTRANGASVLKSDICCHWLLEAARPLSLAPLCTATNWPRFVALPRTDSTLRCHKR